MNQREATLEVEDATLGAEGATLVVLAGGSGRRMGGPKSALTYGGMPALAWIARRLAWPGPTLLVTAPSNRAPAGRECFDAEVVDPADDEGPLRGLLTGIEAVRGVSAVFVPVDLPLLTRPPLAELLARSRGAMCERRDGESTTLEPFPCALPTALRDALARHWASGRRSLKSLVDARLCEVFDASHWPADAWLNVNTPADLAALDARIAAGA